MSEAANNKKRTNRIIYYALLVLFIGIFVVSAAYLILYFAESHAQQEDYNNLASIVESIQNAQTQASEPTDPPQTTDPVESTDSTEPIETEPIVTEPPEILPEYVDLHNVNNHMVGWIKVAGTKINYPVVQTGPENKDYYLNHDFYGRARGCGAIYADEKCDVFGPSDNIILYGHHMKDMSMFAGLDYYKQQSFWQDHQTFTFDTLYEHHTYQVFAVFTTSGYAGVGYPYHYFVNAGSEETFDDFISDIKGMAMYETGVSAEYGDKLLCLSTCEYSQDNGRFVVVAKRIS